jgi:hypothetical protein
VKTHDKRETYSIPQYKYKRTLRYSLVEIIVIEHLYTFSQKTDLNIGVRLADTPTSSFIDLYCFTEKKKNFLEACTIVPKTVLSIANKLK